MSSPEITRLYYGLLDRAPDAAGLQSWETAAHNGASLTAIAQSFLNSGEYAGQHAGETDQQFVDHLYTAALGRAADPSGEQSWLYALSHGSSRADVAVGIIESPEAQQHLAAQVGSAAQPQLTSGFASLITDATDAAVARLYYGLLNRAPDAAGLQHWEAAAHNGSSISAVAQAFLGSSEYAGQHAGETDKQFVDHLYTDALGRAADPSGEQSWLYALSHGSSRADVAVSVIESPEAQQHLAAQIQQPTNSAGAASTEVDAGTTYYVDAAAGSDNNNGTSASSAFASIQKIDSLHLKAGDTILFHTGETFSGTLTIADSGTATSHITVGSYGGGTSPIIATSSDNGVVITGSYVTVQDVHVTGAAQAGIQIAGAYDTVQRTEIDHSGFGVLTQGSYGLFTQNNVHDLHMIVNTPGGNDDYGAVAFDIQGSHNEFSFNNVNNAEAPSYDYGQDGGGFEFWRSSSDTYIHDNTVTNSEGFVEAGGLSGDTINNVRIENNTITNDTILGWLHNDPSLTFGCNISSWDIGGNTLTQTAGIGSNLVLGGSVALHDNFFL